MLAPLPLGRSHLLASAASLKWFWCPAQRGSLGLSLSESWNSPALTSCGRGALLHMSPKRCKTMSWPENSMHLRVCSSSWLHCFHGVCLKIRDPKHVTLSPICSVPHLETQVKKKSPNNHCITETPWFFKALIAALYVIKSPWSFSSWSKSKSHKAIAHWRPRSQALMAEL